MADVLGFLADNDIGVIAPYHAQVRKLRVALRPIADAVKVGSVEEFQGQVRIIQGIISTLIESFMLINSAGTTGHHHINRAK